MKFELLRKLSWNFVDIIDERPRDENIMIIRSFFINYEH